MAHPRAIAHFRTHDYRFLVQRWRAVAKAAGLRMFSWHEADGYSIFALETKRPHPGQPWIYISAGIHGDEAGATEGFVTWAEQSIGRFGEFNALLFPCLNPWGLVNNSRYDSARRDLNRTYHDDSVPQTAAHRRLFAGRRFKLALTLHEDYDANGIYIYEPPKNKPFWGEKLLAAARKAVPIDHRKSIEGRGSRAGVVRRRISGKEMPEHPEALTLHFENADRTFTIETPSEHHIDARVEAQIAVIDRAVDLCLSL